MLTLSQLAHTIPASPIRKLIPLAEAAAARGLKVYRLNMGQPDVPSPAAALEPVKNNRLKLISYTHSAGEINLRKGLAQYYRNLGIDACHEDILITAGASEALQFALNITCDPGDEVIVFEPFYTNYNTFATEFACKFVAVSTSIEDGFALPSMSEVEKCITPRTKAVLLNNPGNPTGTIYSKEALMQLGEIVRKHNIFLIADEVYREFCYTSEPHFSCMQLEGLDQNLILVDSVSKRYSLCGARIGNILSKNKEFMAACLRFCQARLCVSTYGQIAALGALDTPPEYFAAVKAEYIRRRDTMLQRLNQMPGVFSPTPQGAFYTIASLPVDDTEEFVKWTLNHFEYEGQTVMIVPAAGFYLHQEKGRNQARIAYVLEVDQLQKAMDCLERALAAYPGRTR